MSLDPLTAAFDLGKIAIEKLWPDPTKRAVEIRKLQELTQKGDIAKLNSHVKLMVGQLEVNKAEAQHKSIFVAGWRPFVGWVGGFSLAYTGIIYPLLLWGWAIWGPAGIDAPPAIESGLLGTILTGMLGIGTMRSFDKSKGTATQKIT